MKTYEARGLLLLGVLLGGCGASRDPGSQQSDGSGIEASAPTVKDGLNVGTVIERSQFANGTCINEVQLQNNGMQLLLTADVNPVTVQIFYVGDKTTDSGRSGAGATLQGTVSLAADQTVAFPVNLNNAAFSPQAYGAIVLNALGDTPQDVFQTYVQSGLDIWSAGGSVFNGGSYRIPYFTGTTGVVIAVTSQSDFNFEVDFSLMAGAGGFHSIMLPPLSTYLFDSRTYGWNVTGIGSVQVTTNASGTVYMSAYEYRGSTVKTRIAPVKAAPYP